MIYVFAKTENFVVSDLKLIDLIVLKGFYKRKIPKHMFYTKSDVDDIYKFLQRKNTKAINMNLCKFFVVKHRANIFLEAWLMNFLNDLIKKQYGQNTVKHI